MSTHQNVMQLDPTALQFRLPAGVALVRDPVALWIELEQQVGTLGEDATVGQLVTSIRTAMSMRVEHTHTPDEGEPQTYHDSQKMSDSEVVGVYLKLRDWVDGLGKGFAPTRTSPSGPATGERRQA